QAQRPLLELRPGGQRDQQGGRGDGQHDVRGPGDAGMVRHLCLLVVSARRRRQVSHFSGSMTRGGNRTSSSSTTSSAHRKGHRPVISSLMEIREMPQITFRTTPTGGVIRPIALFMMNSTPK